MSRDIMSAVPEANTWDKNLSDFTAGYRSLLQRVKDLDEKNQELQADLQDQTQSRRTWMRRAQEHESRITQSQYVLLLVDGNQSCFTDKSITDGITGANDVAATLTSEVAQIARSCHKDDLSDKLAVTIQMFVDIDRLGDDLLAAGSLSSKSQLYAFFKALSSANSSIHVVYCGPERAAIDAKLRDTYELNVENLHCRHIILALGYQSEYYEVLDSYSQDELTRSKTSLMKSDHGFPAGLDLPYHLANFSVLDTVPLISFDNRSQHPTVSNSDTATSKPKTLPLIVSSNRSGSNAMSDPGSIDSSGKPSSTPLATVDRFMDKLERSQSHSSSRRSNMSLQASDSDKPTSSTGKQPPAINQPPQKPNIDTLQTYEQPWELNHNEYAYSPPVITTPWGGELIDTTPVQEPPAVAGFVREVWSAPRAQHRRQDSNRQQSTWPKAEQDWTQPAPTSQTRNRTRDTPISLDGTWDEIVARGEVGTFAPPPLPRIVNHDTISNKPPFRLDVVCNRKGQRIDQPLPDVSQADLDVLKARSEQKHLCNEFHLRGKCHNKGCKFDHEPLDDGVVLALRHLARTMPCDIGPSCRRNECYLGHRCPHNERRNGCKKRKSCPFAQKGMHDITDLEIANIFPA